MQALRLLRLAADLGPLQVQLHQRHLALHLGHLALLAGAGDFLLGARQLQQPQAQLVHPTGRSIALVFQLLLLIGHGLHLRDQARMLLRHGFDRLVGRKDHGGHLLAVFTGCGRGIQPARLHRGHGSVVRARLRHHVLRGGPPSGRQLRNRLGRRYGRLAHVLGGLLGLFHALDDGLTGLVRLHHHAVLLCLGLQRGIGHAVVGFNGRLGHGLPGVADLARRGRAAGLHHVESLFCRRGQRSQFLLRLHTQVAQGFFQALDSRDLPLDGGPLLVQRGLRALHAFGADLARFAHGLELLLQGVNGLQAVSLGDRRSERHFNGASGLLHPHPGFGRAARDQVHRVDSLLSPGADLAQRLGSVHAQLVKAGRKHQLIDLRQLLGANGRLRIGQPGAGQGALQLLGVHGRQRRLPGFGGFLRGHDSGRGQCAHRADQRIDVLCLIEVERLRDFLERFFYPFSLLGQFLELLDDVCGLEALKLLRRFSHGNRKLFLCLRGR